MYIKKNRVISSVLILILHLFLDFSFAFGIDFADNHGKWSGFILENIEEEFLCQDKMAFVQTCEKNEIYLFRDYVDNSSNSKKYKNRERSAKPSLLKFQTNKKDPLEQSENGLEIDPGRFDSQFEGLLYDSRSFIIYGLGMMMILRNMPEKFSNWDKSELSHDKLWKNWRSNVAGGPVIDEDGFLLNFVAHPYVGASYYSAARHRGYEPIQSFFYSFFMSTIVWEFGMEATAEPPSIQDIIVTPFLGSPIGELFYYWSNNIQNNHGEVMGSERLGSFLLAFLNPGGHLSEQINTFLGTSFVHGARTYWFFMDRDVPFKHRFLQFERKQVVGLEMVLKF